MGSKRAPSEVSPPLKEPSVNDSIKREAYTRAMNRVDLMNVAKKGSASQTS